jgi:hypothetical protein
MRRSLRALTICIAGIATLVALASPAAAMYPNFYAHLDLTNGRHTVVAGGPCHWQAGDTWATITDVTITQGSVTATRAAPPRFASATTPPGGWTPPVPASSAPGRRRPTPWRPCTAPTAPPTSTHGKTTSSSSSLKKREEKLLTGQPP